MKKTLYVIVAFLCVCFVIPAFAGDLNDESDVQLKLTNMELLLKSISGVEKEMANIQVMLQSDKGVGREDELRTQIYKLSEKRRELEATFSRLSADVDLSDSQGEKKAEFNWQKELKELFMPLIREVKQVTSRPREIEELRNNIDFYQSQLPMIQKALSNIDFLLSMSKSEELSAKLEMDRAKWKSRENETKTRLNIAANQLQRKTGQKKTWSQSAHEIVQIFFKSRGRNLFLSFLAFVLTWLFLFYVHKLIQRLSPLHRGERTFSSRFFDMLFFIFNGVLSFMAAVSVLYFYGDWVLLSIAVIFVFGIGWASKQTIPRVWNQAKLILNIGPVREGEIVVYNGLPYEVMSINFFSTLSNPYLDGGTIRLPIRDLLDYRSRPETENEPWFPCRTGDWVKLSNGTHGKVSVQTSETVKLELLGGGVMFYRTPDFLALSPMNVSNGFRLWITFRLDYSHQSQVTDAIPEMFNNEITNRLTALGYSGNVRNILVHFKEAGLNSLDIEILADFKGGAGPDYDMLQRIIPRICVDICNRNNWVIPFHQLKVHMSG